MLVSLFGFPNYTVCPKRPVKMYLHITQARKHSITLDWDILITSSKYFKIHRGTSWTPNWPLN